MPEGQLTQQHWHLIEEFAPFDEFLRVGTVDECEELPFLDLHVIETIEEELATCR